MTGAAPTFYVYVYGRPDGTTFYIGKGLKRRALSLSPSRRTPHFMNIVEKYGRGNITLTLTPCASEAEAFALERKHIAAARLAGERIVNATDGGEGCSGRKPNVKSLAALTVWHGAFHRLSDGAKQRILEGRAKGRSIAKLWRASEAGRAHLRGLGEAGAVRLHQERSLRCGLCQEGFATRSAKAKFCSRRCEQRHRRAHGPVYSATR